MQAVLYHHGVPKRADLLTRENRAWVQELPLPAAGREQIAVGLAVIDAIEVRLAPFDRELCRYARRQPGCKALQGHYGIGALTSVTILAELGDVRRFDSSRQVVRYGGMDTTVHASDKRRAPGHLSRQGPPALRWALYQAAQAASRERSPDRDYFLQAAERLGRNRACLALARKLLKRCYHTLKDLGQGGTRARMSFPRARTPSPQADAPRPAPGILLPPRSRGRPPKTDRPPCPSPTGNPITIMSPTRSQPEIVDRDKHGHPRAHNADSASPAPVKRSALSPPPAALRVTERRSWRSHTTRWPSPPGHPNNFTPTGA